MPTTEQRDEWAKADLLMRFPPELLKIFGKHSKLWNHDKMETLLLLDEWIQLDRIQLRIDTIRQAIGTLRFENLELTTDQVKSLNQWIDQLESQKNQLTKGAQE